MGKMWKDKTTLLLFLVLSSVGLSLESCSDCESTSCTGIHACYNCNAQVDSDCSETLTGVDADTCRSYLSTSDNRQALYSSSTQECKLSQADCTNSYTSSTDIVLTKTCDPGCSNYTITKLDDQAVVSGSGPYASHGYKFYSSACQHYCLPPSQDCTVSFEPYESLGTCYVYNTSCGGSCTTESSSNRVVYKVTCDALVCPSLTNPMNGSVDTSAGKSPGDQAIYSCNTGYILVGSSFTTCGSDGNWDTVAPTCTPVDCGPLSDPNNGSVTYSETTYGYQANYNCDNGFTMSGSSVVTCGSDANWNNTVPTCTPVDCGPLSDPNNGSVTYSETTYGYQANYNCDNGFTMSGSSVVTCGSDANWNNTAPTCSPVDCGPLSDPNNGSVTYSETTYGSKANYNCDNGFKLSGSPVAMCGSDVNWNSSAPTCERADCGPLSKPADGFVSYTNFTYGSQAEYTCKTGYSMYGSSTRTCLTNGTWDPVKPSCEPVDCGDLSAPTDGSVNTSLGTTFHQKASFSCDSGYKLSHKASRVCQASGQWSGSSPVCNQEGAVTEATTQPTQLYIMPCICYTNKTFVNMTQEEIIQQLISETKIDTKTTKLAQFRLKSRSDPRLSSKTIGVVAVAILSTLGGIMLFSDILTLGERRRELGY